MGPMDLADWLASPAAEGALASADEAVAQHPGDPLAAGTQVRRAHLDITPEQAAAALDQAHLRELARHRYGIDTPGLLLTRDGLEQATRPAVAARRAQAVRASGAQRVLDLTAGLGFDVRAFVDAGLEVIAVERDRATARFLAHDVPGAEVVVADATEPKTLAELLSRLGPADVVFVDPARRDPAGPRGLATGRARTERDPARWSPPWPFVMSLPHPRVAAKVAPSFAAPPGWQAEWTSVDRTVVECALYSWPVLAHPRQAALISAGGSRVIEGSDLPATVAPALGAFVHEPDPALLLAGALPAVMRACPGTGLLDTQSTWLSGDTLPEPYLGLRSYRVVTEVGGSTRQQRALLARHGVDRLVVKSRDTADDPRTVLRSLGMREGSGHTLVMTRRAGRALTLLVRPEPARPA